jgi:hypothetical protein
VMASTGDKREVERPLFGRRFIAGLLVATAILSEAACGSGRGRGTGHQPIQTEGSSAASLLEALPRYHPSEALAYRIEKGGMSWQSFKAPDVTPAEVLEFYARRLRHEGWETVEPVEQSGSATIRGTWTNPGWVLKVSATPSPGSRAKGLGTDEDSEYRLNLRRRVTRR